MTGDDRDPLAQQYAAVVRFLRRSGNTRENAEDLAQTVFEEAVDNAPREDDGRPAIAWLYTVARRRAIDQFRRETRQREIQQQLPTIPAADEVYGAHVRAVLRTAIGALPSQQREVVVRRLIADISFKEIADELGTTEAACKMRFVRGLSTLREALQREGLEP